MSDHTDFEKRLSDWLSRTEEVETPPLTSSQLEWLRSLIPSNNDSSTVPTLSFVWKKVTNDVAEKLEIISFFQMKEIKLPLSPMRADDNELFEKTMFSCSLPDGDGELWVHVLPIGNRKAKVAIMVKGFEGQANLSVELLTDEDYGKRLIEARPLKDNNAEMTINGIGRFFIALYSGADHIGSMGINIEELKE